MPKFFKVSKYILKDIILSRLFLYLYKVMKGVYIFLAPGFEDVEALCTRDILVRGGVDARLVSITDDLTVESARGLVVLADMSIFDLESSVEETVRQDVMIFPGGMPGAKNLGDCEPLVEMMNEHYSRGGSLAAICAAPSMVLGKLADVEGLQFTCYDGCEAVLEARGASFVRKPSVRCGRIVTGRGPGHSVNFGLEILSLVKGDEVARKVSADFTLECE